MKIYEVWRDGYDGCDETDSYWFSRQSAETIASRLNKERPQEGFEWHVVEHEVRDLPASAELRQHAMIELHELSAVALWLTGRDTGVSSQYMASVAIAGKVTQSEWLDPAPSDAPDLGRCIRLIEKAPTVRNCFPILRQASPVWRAYVDHWDELTALWHQGDYHATTGRMRVLRSSANNKLCDGRDEKP